MDLIATVSEQWWVADQKVRGSSPDAKLPLLGP